MGIPSQNVLTLVKLIQEVEGKKYSKNHVSGYRVNALLDCTIKRLKNDLTRLKNLESKKSKRNRTVLNIPTVKSRTTQLLQSVENRTATPVKITGSRRNSVLVVNPSGCNENSYDSEHLPENRDNFTDDDVLGLGNFFSGLKSKPPTASS
ncbi:hypothetical protein SNE40_010612 [Patella caerulea]|uniref:Uncharacterized protein n=1 Tax=Patella caerulea TaxID=87958 RepID=A0AAN8K290_PATCE